MTTAVSANLNVDTIVAALMKPAQQKVANIANQIASYQVKISDIGQLKSSLSSLETDIQSIDGTQSSPMTPDQLKTALQQFVTDYNSAVPNTKNSTSLSIKRFSEYFRKELDPSITTQIGLSFDKTGKAQFDTVKFDSANTTNPTTLTNLVSHVFDTAVASGSVLTHMVETNGSLDSMQNTYQYKVNQLTQKEDRMNTQLVTTEANYRKQFNALQAMLTQMDSNQAIITNLIPKSTTA